MTPAKCRSVVKAARAYLSASGEWDVPCRFDLVCVRDAGATFELDYYRHVFDISEIMGSGRRRLATLVIFLPRAREVLEGADMVLAEDTRRAGLLCQRCGVKAKRFMSFMTITKRASWTKCWAC